MKYTFGVLTLLLIVMGCSLPQTPGMYASDGTNYEPVPGPGASPVCCKSSRDNYTDYGENPYVAVAESPVSTFSVDADGASYANCRRYLLLGQKPPAAAVRIEEFINYFTFDYKEPGGDEQVSLESELTTCPWANGHHLLRLGIKGATIPDDELPNANYVFLIDVSGSMEAANRLELLKKGFMLLAENLRDHDRVAIVTYAGTAGVHLQSTSGENRTAIKQAIDKLSAGGSTAGAQGISTAYEIAQQNFIAGGNNRVILGTDGDFNVGTTSTEALKSIIAEKRKSGIFLTVLGVGAGNLNDAMMEQLANYGNGTYEYIDNIRQLQKIFVDDRARFFTVAADAKIQVAFNPQRVEKYRLIGYENRALTNEDFSNDTVDAGEIGAGQTITAVYELLLRDTATEEPCASFDVRYKKPGTETSRQLIQVVNAAPAEIADASENMRFCASVVTLGLLLKKSAYRGAASKNMAIGLCENARSFDPSGLRAEFRGLLASLLE